MAFDELSAYLAAHEAAEEEAHPAARRGAGGVLAPRLAEERDAGTLITTLAASTSTPRRSTPPSPGSIEPFWSTGTAQNETNSRTWARSRTRRH